MASAKGTKGMWGTRQLSGERMPEVQANGIQIHYQTGGAGQRVLFISGTGGDLRVRPNVLDGPLAASRRVIAYDQRGLGQTGKPEGPYSMAQYADDAAGLLDALDLRQVDVVGVSFGGMVAQHLALQHPDRIHRLVLCCTSPGGAMPSFPFHELPEGIDAVDRMLRLMAVSDVRRDAAWQAANPERVQKMIDITRAGVIADHATPEYQRGYREQLLARAGHDTLDRLSLLDLPTLICAGRYDGIAPPENQEKLHQLIPGSALRWFEGGHLFLVQDKTAWPEIIAWIDRVD